MILVVDFNVVFDKFEFISPQYMYSELDKNLGRLISLSKLPKENILEVLDFIIFILTPTSSAFYQPTFSFTIRFMFLKNFSALSKLSFAGSKLA